MGCCSVNVEYNGQSAEMPLLIVEGSGPSLMGRDWLSQIQLNWKQIHHIHTASLQAVLARYPAVFQKGLGTLNGYKAKIHVDPDAVPRFHRARSVPYAIRDKVDKELQRLQEEGTLEPVEIAEWAAPKRHVQYTRSAQNELSKMHFKYTEPINLTNDRIPTDSLPGEVSVKGTGIKKVD